MGILWTLFIPGFKILLSASCPATGSIQATTTGRQQPNPPKAQPPHVQRLVLNPPSEADRQSLVNLGYETALCERQARTETLDRVATFCWLEQASDEYSTLVLGMPLMPQ